MARLCRLLGLFSLLALGSLGGLACSAAAPALARIALRGADPASQLTVDGAPAGSMADYQHSRLRLPPGHHVFTLRSAQGAVTVREADVGPGDDIALDFNPAGGSR